MRGRANCQRTLAVTVGFLAVAVTAACGASDEPGEASDGGFTGGDFHSLVVDPSDPARIYVGGHEAVAVSEDQGRTWQEVEALRNADAMGWAFVDGAIYVSGHPGLNRSLDGGRTFLRVNDGLPDTDVHALGGISGFLVGATPSAGVIASEADGTWMPVSPRAGSSFFGRILAVGGEQTHLFAADVAAGVAESTDGGRQWRPVDAGLPSAAWISGEGNIVVASGPAGAVVSRDNGSTWARLAGPPGSTLIELVSETTMLAGVHANGRVNVFISADAGESWTAT